MNTDIAGETNLRRLVTIIVVLKKPIGTIQISQQKSENTDV